MIAAVADRIRSFIRQPKQEPPGRKRSLDRSADDEESDCGEPANKRSRSSSSEDDGISRSTSVSYRRIISGKFFSVFNSLMSTLISDRKLPDHCKTEDETEECSSGEEREKEEDGESSGIQRVTGGIIPPAPEPSTFSNKEDEVQFLGAVPKPRLPIGSYQRAESSKDDFALSSKSPPEKTNTGLSPSFRFKSGLLSTSAVSPSSTGGSSKFYNKLEVSSPVGGPAHSILGSKSNSLSKKPGGINKSLHDKYFGFSARKPSPCSTIFKRRISSAARESFRLEDKLQYKLLLQQCTTTSTLPPLYSIYKRQSVSSSPNNSRSTSPLSAITISRLDETIGEEKKKEYEQSLARPPIHASPRDATAAKAIEVIDLIRSESESSNVAQKDSDNDSVVITGEVRKTEKRKNSLERKFLTSPVYHHDWMKSLRERYDTKERNAAVEAASMEETKKRLEARRKNEIEKELEERITRNLTLLDLTYPTKVQDIQPEEEVPELPPLTPDMENVIDHALQRTGLGEVMVEKFSIRITRKDLHTLSGLNWLNDEVINFYMNLLMDRGKQDSHLSVYAFNTFFYPKLVTQGYSSLRRWTRKVDVFSHDLLLVPVHLGMHWCLATIDLRNKIINYYDSMLGDNDKCLHALLKYLQSEHEDKKKQPYDTGDWDIVNVKDIPQQMNGSDCGMFTCKFAEYLSRNVKITFTQEDMPYFRRRMVYEIVTQSLL